MILNKGFLENCYLFDKQMYLPKKEKAVSVRRIDFTFLEKSAKNVLLEEENKTFVSVATSEYWDVDETKTFSR